ncbi:MAG: hypothetical protein K0Q95_1992 [Bacteroidota bacterium]|jgi:subtilisin-like proprotein convertase family protein|nr:hypothetical protein [Bacteroidota bacterium]
MKRLLRSAAILIAFTFSTGLYAQDPWILSARDGLDNMNNNTVFGMNVFNGKIYAAVGPDSGYVYSSTTGNINSWVKVFSGPTVNSVNAITSTTAAGGNMYISARSNSDSSRVFRTMDGVNWLPYYVSPEPVTGLIPFKGAGAVDSLYVIEGFNYWGGRILRSHANSNDPNSLSAQWDTVLDFGQLNPYTNITAVGVHNSKFYVGTSHGGIWISADGSSWIENGSVGNGFGNFNNLTITAISSFGGAVYVGTENNFEGGQIWKSTDDINWVQVHQLPYTNTIVTSMSVADGKLWYTAKGDYSGIVAKSSDGITFTISDNGSFNSPGNNGNRASLTQFGNNIYWGGEHFYSLGGKTPFNMPGAQIWRTCLVTPPAVNAGPDLAVCPGTPVTFDGGPGATAYYWGNGESQQSFTTAWTGYMILEYVGSNGCSTMDSVLVDALPSPSVMITNPQGLPGLPNVVCKGVSTNITGTAISNAYTALPPIHKSTNDSISDLIPMVYDTINVSGLSTACACDALMSVTIDSMYHTYVGDLEIKIQAPDGSSTILNAQNEEDANDAYFGTQFIMNAAESISNATAPYNGNYQPVGSFHDLTGSPNGNWVLSIQDLAGGDDGNLKGWTIRFKIDDNTLTYSWSPALGLTSTTTLNTTATPLVSTTYTLTTTNNIGCATVTPVAFEVPDLVFEQAADTVCYGSSIILTVDGGSQTTIWSPGATLDATTGYSVTATPTVSTQYYVTDTVDGCPLWDSIYVYANGQLFLTSPAPQTICYNDTATFTANVSGGSAPYIYTWDTGGSFLYGETIQHVPSGGTSYTISATDLAGCFIGGGSTSVAVIPSTDVYGHVSYSGGTVNGSSVVLYKYYPFLTQFDTAQVTTTDGNGDFYFPSVDHNNYLIEVYPAASYTALVPTYYGNNYLWDSALVLSHYCSVNDTLNIAAVEFPPITGPGSLQGNISEGPGYTGGFMGTIQPGDRVPGEPIPGIDVKLGRNPGGQLVVNTTTDANGDYSFSNLPLNNANEWYTVYVDIPGLGRDSSYSVVLDPVNNAYIDLDYYVDSTVVYIVDELATGIKPTEKTEEASFNVFPNPSKGEASISYTLAEESNVSLSIYNVLGVKISELVSSKQSKGKYKYSITPKDQELSNGIYFVTLITNNKSETHRLVINK